MDQISKVIPNEYILEYSSAVALLYIKKYWSKTFHKFKIHSIANINFFSMMDDHSRQAKGLWRTLIPLWYISISLQGYREC